MSIQIILSLFQVESLHNEQANTDFSILCELLKDYIALVGAIRVKITFNIFFY